MILSDLKGIRLLIINTDSQDTSRKINQPAAPGSAEGHIGNEVIRNKNVWPPVNTGGHGNELFFSAFKYNINFSIMENNQSDHPQTSKKELADLHRNSAELINKILSVRSTLVVSSCGIHYYVSPDSPNYKILQDMLSDIGSQHTALAQDSFLVEPKTPPNDSEAKSSYS